MKCPLLPGIAALLLALAPLANSQSVSFDGATGSANFGAPSALGSAQFTVETWFLVEGHGLPVPSAAGSIVALVSRGTSFSDTNYLLAFRPADNRLVGGFGAGAGTVLARRDACAVGGTQTPTRRDAATLIRSAAVRRAVTVSGYRTAIPFEFATWLRATTGLRYSHPCSPIRRELS